MFPTIHDMNKNIIFILIYQFIVLVTGYGYILAHICRTHDKKTQQFFGINVVGLQIFYSDFIILESQRGV